MHDAFVGVWPSMSLLATVFRGRLAKRAAISVSCRALVDDFREFDPGALQCDFLLRGREASYSFLRLERSRLGYLKRRGCAGLFNRQGLFLSYAFYAFRRIEGDYRRRP